MLEEFIYMLQTGKRQAISQIAAIGRRYKTLRYPILLFLAVYIFVYNFTLHFCLFIRLKERMAKAIAVATCFCLLITSVNITALAFSDVGEPGIESEQPAEGDASGDNTGEATQPDTSGSDAAGGEGAPADPGNIADDPAANDPADNEEADETLADEELLEEETLLEEDPKDVAFNQFLEVDEAIITVTADPGVFPDGAFLSARKVNPEEADSISVIVGRVRPQDRKVSVSYSYDVRIYDKNHNELQPNTAKGSVRMSFKMAENTDENLLPYIWHVEYTEQDGFDAVEVPIIPDEGAADEIVIEPSEFSYYYSVDYCQKEEPADEQEEEEEEEELTPAFEQSVTVDGVIITVTADEGVFPEDASVTARKASASEENTIAPVLDEVREGDKNVALSYTFDITILDKDGNEIQPDVDKGSVKVSFQMAQIANVNLDTDIYHIKESASGLNATGLNVNTESGANNEAVVETTGFSFYTVEFTYGGLCYVLNGDEKVALSTILETVGIVENGEITAVVSSNETLFAPVNENDTWYIQALQAFESEEWLKVTIDEIEYEILVTDEQEYLTWADLKTALADSSEATITLQGDVTAPDSGSGTLEVNGTKTLDLNGYVINANNKGFRVFNVTSSATLTLEDSRPNEAHDDSSLPVGGVITGGDTTKYQNIGGSGINVESGATLNMNGGTIYNNRAYTADGGDYRYNNGGGVRNAGTFIMSGGAIKNNECKYGAGVLLVDRGEFIMSGGSITENRTHNQGNGAGVYLKGGTFKMTGGVITNNKSSWSGGGVYVPEKGFLDTNTTISITLGGTAQIYNNKGYQDDSKRTAEHNLYIQPTGPTDKAVPDSIIHIATGDDDAPTDGMNVHVFVAEYSNYLTVASPIQITHTNGEDYSKYFTPDVTNRRIGNLDNNQLYWGIPLDITNEAPESSKDTNNGYIEVDKSQAIYQEEVNVTVHSNTGYVLESLKFDDTDITEGKKFNMPSDNVIVTATFINLDDSYAAYLVPFDNNPRTTEGNFTYWVGGIGAQKNVPYDGVKVTVDGETRYYYKNVGAAIGAAQAGSTNTNYATGSNSNGVFIEGSGGNKYATGNDSINPNLGKYTDKVVLLKDVEDVDNRGLWNYGTGGAWDNARGKYGINKGLIIDMNGHNASMIAAGNIPPDQVLVIMDNQNKSKIPYIDDEGNTGHCTGTVVLSGITIDDSIWAANHHFILLNGQYYLLANNISKDTGTGDIKIELRGGYYRFDPSSLNGKFDIELDGVHVEANATKFNDSDPWGPSPTNYTHRVLKGGVQYNIKLDINAGTDTVYKDSMAYTGETLTKIYGTNLTLPSNLKRTNYRLLGWSTNRTDTAATYQTELNVDLSKNYGDTKTLYAVWEEHIVNKWDELKKALNGTGTDSIEDVLEINGSTIKLLTDFNNGEGGSGKLTVSGTKTLDLNGHVINGNGMVDMITIPINNTLTLEDSNPNTPHTGVLSDGGYFWTWDGGNGSGNTTITGGILTGAKGDNDGGVNDAKGVTHGPINVAGTFIMNAGTIAGCGVNGTSGASKAGAVLVNDNISGNYAKLYMNGANIEYCRAYSDGSTGREDQWTGIVNVNLGDFEMTGGYIRNCSSSTNKGVAYGGAIMMSRWFANTVKINGGTISNCRSDMGGAVCMEGGTLDLVNTTIQNCYSSGMGGAIAVTDTSSSSNGAVPAEINISGGKITGNRANGIGGAIRLRDATLNMTGGEISNNTSDNGTGGGIDNSETINNVSGQIKIGGSAIITGNTASGKDNNVYLGAGRTINVSSNPASSMNVGVTTQTKPTASNPVPITNQNSADYSARFTSDDTSYEVINDGNIVYLIDPAAYVASITTDSGTKLYETLQNAFDAASTGQTVKLLKDVTENNVNLSGKTIIFDINGKVLNATSGSVLTVNEGADLTLTDTNPNTPHKGTIDSNGLWTWDQGANDGSTTIKGGIITGGKGTSQDGATYGGGVLNKGTFRMLGGTIAGNTAAFGGGVAHSQSFTMTGGTITNNVATQNGGGVMTDGFLALGGSAQITGNTQGKTKNNVYLPDGRFATISSTAPTSDMNIGVTTQTTPTPKNGVKIVDGADSTNYKYFVSDKTDETIVFCNGYDVDKDGNAFTDCHTSHEAGTVWLGKHTHTWKTFMLDGKLVSYCTKPGCEHYAASNSEAKENGKLVPLTIIGLDQVKNGDRVGLGFGTGAENEIWDALGIPRPTILYRGRGTTDYDQSATPPTEPGKYTAMIYVDGELIDLVDFEINKPASPSASQSGGTSVLVSYEVKSPKTGE